MSLFVGVGVSLATVPLLACFSGESVFVTLQVCVPAGVKSGNILAKQADKINIALHSNKHTHPHAIY